MIIRKVDSKGRIVLPEELRKDKVAVTRFANRAIVVPLEDPYEDLCGKISGPPLRELRKRTEEWLLKETAEDAE
ncbi:hypothetical protein AKJ37_05895 [candidate division MSBL1 archaeon SCGC-AAA259I09]|uniref:SpoVT-AbrB domain-containing protein n=2 Tax=candidate division MSBL1 TaxID=215777 RepID=A0A133UPL6_9EURY|nr:hypothetical protein AKJ66_04385 [candidate division MSBL1 archaeon SCGC-AAA259E22]KXA96172.1 hypothetical protein AKJ37_05895 [candidate division MSBL1 archaeon SCGC-AAA259I09]